MFAELLAVALVGFGCGGSLSRHKEVVTCEPVFADLRTPSTREQEAQDFEKIRSGDIISINFNGPRAPELMFVATVRNDGTVTLLSNKVFTAVGKTMHEFEREVYSYYGPRFSRLVSTDPAPFMVAGEVKEPGKRPFLGQLTILQAIEMAGGFTDDASKRHVFLIRADGREYVIDCVHAQRDRRLDVPVYPNDRIFVPEGRPRW
jgi:polysaccharide export outer membrane protein